MLLSKKNPGPIWEETNVPSFSELILSWNAKRPEVGAYRFWISIHFKEGWSSWVCYADWGSDDQKSYRQESSLHEVHVHQDILTVAKGWVADGFRVKIEGDLPVDWLYVSLKTDSLFRFGITDSVVLPFSGLSQMELLHPRKKDLCSPTSTTAVIRFLQRSDRLCPERFAHQVLDKGFDIFGNWVFNTAQAFHELSPRFRCWVERLDEFSSIEKRLKRGFPTIVSVRGPLLGSATPYASGHLMVVIGCDAKDQKVLCMDPAFPSSLQTLVAYEGNDFMQAWERRGFVSYCFDNY